MTNTQNTPTKCQHCDANPAVATVSQWIDGTEDTWRVCDPCLPAVSEFATVTFDADEDAPAPTILDEVHALITRYVAFSEPEQADVLSLFVLHTHAFQYARTTPYIYITSAEKQSGKTRTLEVLEQLCRNATRADNLTSSVMFRMIEHLSPTLMVDEVDTIFSGAKNEELRGVLNSGYKSAGKVYRAIGNPTDENGGLVSFRTFCPKILAGIDNGQVPDTVLDRAIRIVLKRKAAGQHVEEFYAEDVEVETEELRERIEAWMNANSDTLADRTARPARIEGLGDRANEISRPLLALARLCPGWDVRARNALKALLGEDELKLSPQARALLVIRDWFDANPDAKWIPSKVAMEITGQNGKRLGGWMAAYDVKPAGFTKDGERGKGYRRVDLEDAFNRYLPNREG
jgi:hypothetical protein